MVDALNRVKYVDIDFNKNKNHPRFISNNHYNTNKNKHPDNFPGDNNGIADIDNSNFNNNNNNYLIEGAKNEETDFEIDEFRNLNKKQHLNLNCDEEGDDNNNNVMSYKYNDNYKMNNFGSLLQRENELSDEKDDLSTVHYDNAYNENDNYRTMLSSIKNNHRNVINEKPNYFDSLNDEVGNLKNNLFNNNVLHASLKKTDKNSYKHSFSDDAPDTMKNKRNVPRSDLNGVFNDDEDDRVAGTNDNIFSAGNYESSGRNHDEITISYRNHNGENTIIKSVKEGNKKNRRKKKKKKKRDGNGVTTLVDKNVSEKLFEVGGNRNDYCRDKEKYRLKRKKDNDIKVLNNALSSNVVSKNKAINKPVENNGGGKTNNVNGVGIPVVVGNPIPNVKNDLPLMTDSNLTKLVIPTVVAVSSTSSIFDEKHKVSNKYYQTVGVVHSAAVAGCPFGFRSTTQSLSSKKKQAKEDADFKARSVVLAPQLRFNVSASNSDDIRVAHEINDFVANLLYSAGKTGSMRKELGLCKSYDKKFPFHVTKAIDDKLLCGLMDCISNIIRGSMENQKCSEMPPELKGFVDWLLLNGISARDEFKQFMASDASQKKLFLFSGEGACDKNGNPVKPTAPPIDGSSLNATGPNNTAMQRHQNAKQTKIFGHLKKFYNSPINIFADDNNNKNNDEKSIVKNPYTLFKHYIADRKVPILDSDDQKLYNNPQLYNDRVIPYNSDDNEDVNDWSDRNQSIFEGSETENDKYDSDTSLIDPANRIDFLNYFNGKRKSSTKLKRENNDVLEFESPFMYAGGDEQDPLAAD